MDVVTIGETMTLFAPDHHGKLRHAKSFSMQFGGAESNVAIGLSRLGHSARWISRLGEDEFGDAMQRFIQGEGVDVSYVTRDAEAPTGVFFKEFRYPGDIRVYYYRKDSAASQMNKTSVPEAAIKGASFLHITGITPALSSSCRAAAERAVSIAKQHGVTVVFDPNVRMKLFSSEAEAKALLTAFAAKSDIVLPGEGEAAFLFGSGTHDEYIQAFHELGPKRVLLKIGTKGSIVSERGSDPVHVGAFSVAHVADPVGAGDAFAAGVLSGLIDGVGLEEAARRGNAMGALVAMTNGDVEGLPTRADLTRFLGGQANDDVTR